MGPKTRHLLGWVLAGLITALLVITGIFKIRGGAEIEKNVVAMGFTMDVVKGIGIIELICALFFIFPRTGVFGSMLVAAYMGGAIATHLQHNLPIGLPVLIECLVFLSAVIRYPELLRRLVGTTVVV